MTDPEPRKETAVPSARHLFHLPVGGPYLLAHSVGCLPRAARDSADQAFFAPWETAGGEAWPQWLGAIDAFRSALVDLFGGELQQWCPQPGVSAAISRIISGLPCRARRNVILISEHAFPSVAYAVEGLARLGFRMELVTGDPSDLSRWRRLGDPDIAVAVMMHVHSNTGILSPVAELTAMAKAHGVFSIVDIAQSGGILPISVDAWDADAVVGTSVKWLSGGPGACFAWIAPDVTERIMPMERGWFSHVHPFEMDIHHFAFAPDARRLWGGTPSVAPFVIATVGLRTVAEVGVPAIRAHNLSLSGRLLARMGRDLPEIGPLARFGGTLCLALDEHHEAALRAGGVRFDRRGPRLRLSFGLWNDEADVDDVADCLRLAKLG
ncbi:MAG: aminotransferase class V-fold PLP-dependent enzyme [Sphingomonadales bacterium]|nr:aminotransferase class V-fold PLP-dependent enzyme [Sphingomonadales bacterium]MDE2171717.1 aminotransferase class V-fold PLP-dependent enzyme [Sphingomonadales bacterium]